MYASIQTYDDDPSVIMHYGVKRRSGRYPWGSGDDPYQHGRDFLSRVDELKKHGWTETAENIKKEFGLTTTQYRTEKSNAKDIRRLDQIATAKRLKEKEGLGATEIGRKMGIAESTVRSLLNTTSEARTAQAKTTADFLKKQIEKKGMIDIGTGVEKELGVSREMLNKSLDILKEEGYPVYTGRIPQATNAGKYTIQRVLCQPGTEHKEIYNYDKVSTVIDYVSKDGGKSFEKKFTYPSSMSSKRLAVRYAEEGGLERDGLVEIRPGVQDLSLGNSRYSQVRILVDGTHYIKGMAVYSKNLPDGVDVRFNTNKKKGTPITDVLKEITKDPDNPFGSLIKDTNQGGQYWYIDKKTGEKRLGLINKRSDEGDWANWKTTLSAQFLAKQSVNLARKQLQLELDDRKAEYDTLCSLPNPTLKKHLLNKFAEECDSTAAKLTASALPGAKYHVMLPNNTLKDNEVYAPGYQDGSYVYLVRFPHGGLFEMPRLKVNNKNALGKEMIGTTPKDAICVNKNVADRMSGADFDGDFALTIPDRHSSNQTKIMNSDPLDAIKNFDPKMEYPPRPGMKVMRNTQTQMGIISNLITDMTLIGATNDELARAVKHSMVVIDAEKHKLDYKRSEQENNIKELKDKYQRHVGPDGRIYYGASTIISRAGAETTVPKRQGTPKVNIKGTPDYDPNRPEGALIYKLSDDLHYTVKKTNARTGKIVETQRTRTQKSTQMLEVDDARELVSHYKHPMEMCYADFANGMKKLANTARVTAYHEGKIALNKNAEKVYAREKASLEAKLDLAESNKPKERQAQRLTNAEVSKKVAAYKEENGEKMKAGDIKKLNQQTISRHREELGSIKRSDRDIQITDREWEAIQAGAISDSKLKKILNNVNIDKLRERVTPRQSKGLTAAQESRIKALQNAGYTLAEIANKFGVSTSTVSKYL